MIDAEAARALAEAHARAGDGPRTTRVRTWLAAAAADAEAPDGPALAGSAVPKDTAPDCARCTDRCCKAPHQVSLRLLDVAVLLDAGLGEAIAPPPARTSLPVASPRSAVHMPQLRQAANGDCVFLDGDGRCAIYPLRPLTCRRFPYFVDDDAVLGWAASCRSARPAAPGEAEAHARAAVESWRTKARELALIEAGAEALAALGLDPALWARPSGGASFDAVLARHRGR